MPAPSTVDSPDAAFTLNAHLADLDPLSRQRGRSYFNGRRVLRLERSDDATLIADVRGSQVYRVQLVRRSGTWRNTCSCPIGGNCKHVAATALEWLAKLRGAPNPPGQVPAPPKPTFRQQWEPILAEKLGRPLTPDEGVFLGKLSQIFHNLRQSGRVGSYDLIRLGFHTREALLGPYRNAFDGWWETPPRDVLELWQYIAHDIESSGLVVPEFMRPVTDTAAVQARLGDRVRREAIVRWTERLRHLLAVAPPTTLSDVVSQPLELRLCLGPDKWTFETRASDATPWKTAQRTWIEGLMRDSDSFARLEASPAAFAFLAIAQEYYRQNYYVDFTPANPGSRMLLHRLLSHRLARTLVTQPGGAPLEFAPAPLTWHMARSDRDPRDYVIALHRADGQPLGAVALHLAGRPDLYLNEGVVYRGPPPLDGTSAAGAIVPGEAIERPEVLRNLRRLGAALPAEIEARFVTVPLRPRIECWLEFDHGGREVLRLDLLAVADEPRLRLSWAPGAWGVPRGEPPQNTSPDGRRIYTFDTAAADAVTPQLRALGLLYEPAVGHWRRRVTRTFPEEFLAWREALPPGVEVLATGELASLLGAPVRASVAFELIETAAHRDWFDLALALKPEDTTLTAEELELLLRAKGKLVRLPGKGWRRLSVQLDGAPAAALESAGFDPATLADAALGGERHRFHALQLASTAMAGLLPERAATALRARARELARPAAPALPAGLRAELRPYQREGFEFLVFLSVNGLGGVLADDMGLGKTLQALAWLLWLAERRPAAEPLRVLVVCPKSVVGNWEAETARFAPGLDVLRFAPAQAETAMAAHAGRPLIVVANYAQLRLQAKFFQGQAWHAVILDEAQFIKNPSSKVAQIARDLPGAHRLVLTGTPIENRLLDLWSLFAFALPGLLGPQAAFKRNYADDQPLALTRLRARVRHFLLRRTKAQVAADLPARTEEDIVLELESGQERLYQAELKRARAALLRVATPRQLDKARFHILASLLRLRQICCHPALVDPAQRDAPSAKLEELLERVEELRAEGHQVLVFSQFVTMLEIIRDRLVAAGIEHLVLTGQTEDRDALVAEFQANRKKTVFLLSLKAAGFGLNLTAASYVILYDPWWNPAVEAQAIDRTHRIGQAQPVNAYRFIARGTVEEKIRALQREKAALATSIVQEESLAKVLDLESLRQILG